MKIADRLRMDLAAMKAERDQARGEAQRARREACEASEQAELYHVKWEEACADRRALIHALEKVSRVIGADQWLGGGK